VDKIAETRSRLRIPVLGNGDVVDAASALRMFEETGCDGVMIGRGAIKNPWIFQQVGAAMRGEPVLAVSPAEKRRVLLGYYAALRVEFRTDRGALGRMKKIANYFVTGMPHATVLRTAILHSQSPDEAVDAVNAFFDRLQDNRWEEENAVA
jgi:tRNA-dihydrouridine synthase